MEPPSKRICVAADDDRLSDLPDSLIHSILSFLDSRQVVRTSVLSRRWRHLWRAVPCVDFDLTLFCRKTYYELNNISKEEWQPFEEFGNNLSLLNSAASLDKLRIHVPALDYNDRQQVTEACSRWIQRGVQCSPAVIDIHMGFSYRSADWFFPILGSNSSRLTSLHLCGVKLGASFSEELCSGYPLLEELRLVRCFNQFSEIMSKSLRHLTIDDCFGHMQKGILVTAPKLTSLHTSFSTLFCPDGIYVKYTSSFVKASIRVNTYGYGHINPGFWEKLYNIFNVVHLELSGAVMMVSTISIFMIVELH
jgi:hypothetical protein